MGHEYNDVDVITGALQSLKIQMEIDQWTHDVVVRKNGQIVQDADSLYLEVVKYAQDIRFTSKYLTKTFISDLIKANAVYRDKVMDFFENNKWDNKSRIMEIKKALRFSDSDLWKFRL